MLLFSRKRITPINVLLMFALSVLMITTFSSEAAPTSDVRKNAAQQLEQAQKAVDEAQKRLHDNPLRLNDAGLIEIRDVLQQAKNRALEITTALEPELTGIQARLTELGQLDPNTTESGEISSQREQLAQSQAAIESQIKLARLLGVEAGQGLNQIIEYRRERFRAELGRRSQFVLAPAFWINLQRDMPIDLAQTRQVFQEFSQKIITSPAKARIVALSMAALLVLVAEALRRALLSFAINRTKPSRLRRSLYAALDIIRFAVLPGTLAIILVSFLHWDGRFSSEVELFLQQVVAAVFLGGFVTGICSVLLAAKKPTWRLPPLPSELASRLSWLPIALGIAIAFAWSAQQLLDLVNASLTTTLLVNSVTTIILNVLVGIAAWNLRDGKASGLTPSGAEAGAVYPTRGWFRTTQSILVLVIGVSLTALVLGYVALSTLIIQEIIWLGLVGATTYLVRTLTVDLSQSLITRVKESHSRKRLSDAQLHARSQLLVLLSGAIQLAIIVVAFTLVLMPIGEDPREWLNRRLGFLTTGFSVGDVAMKPVSILFALVVLALGLLAVRILRNWIENQLLPATRLDTSMRGSTANLFSYVGYFIVVLMTISSLGFGLERMAWVVSALSVGIGFGLQAIVQNFVSGLILVVERPIRVGDWVSLSGLEGNVRRINARATEIEMFDRSTMIVPNSEFITKTVRNVTMGNPMGVAAVKINMPVSVDVEAVRDIMLNTMLDNPDVLENPAPSVMLAGFDSNGLAFSATSFVSTPRNAAKTRSAILFEMLARFHKSGIPLHQVQSMVVSNVVSENPDTFAEVQDYREDHAAKPIDQPGSTR